MPDINNEAQEVADMLDRLGDEATGATKRMCFAGAAVVADALRAQISADRSLSDRERAALLKGIGISHIETGDGGTTVSVSFDGYTDHHNFAIPFLARIIVKGARGGSAAALAAAIESGTSKRRKNPIVRKTANACKAQAQEAMTEVLLSFIEEEK